jgi:hypothetical protein
MQRLQQLAQQDGITLTLYPWNRGEISQSKLTKIYRSMGFRPTARGAKDMSWQPQQQSVAEGQLNESLSSMVAQDQAERDEYKQFVKSQAGGDWSKGAKLYTQLKKRPSDDIFGDKQRLNQFMKIKFDFHKFTDDDWNNYWLLAQHCDTNRNFQKQALSIIKKYQGPDSPHYKYLYDRISCAIIGTQKYGTQFQCDKDQQGLAESLDQPYPLTWERSEYGDVDALAKLSDGTYLSIMFNQDGGDEWRVEFHRNNSQEVTGEGDSQRVFATVLKAIQQFIKKQQPWMLTFSADKEGYSDADKQSRVRLYDRMVKRYAQAWGYETRQQELSDKVVYELNRAGEGLTEDESHTAISLSRLGQFFKNEDPLAELIPERAAATYALHPDKWESTFYSLTNKDPRKLKYYGPKKVKIPPGTLVGDMAIANKFYRATTDEEKQHYAKLYKKSLQPYPVDVSQYRMPELLIPKTVEENFADGKVKGKSRPGRVQRAGASCKGSVTDLRARARKYGGERGKMYHWCANMKSGKRK